MSDVLLITNLAALVALAVGYFWVWRMWQAYMRLRDHVDGMIESERDLIRMHNARVAELQKDYRTVYGWYQERWELTNALRNDLHAAQKALEAQKEWDSQP